MSSPMEIDCHGGNCADIRRDEEDEYSIHDTKDYGMGPLVVHSAVEYQDHVESAYFADDARLMFDNPEQYRTLGAAELEALRVYVRSTLLHELAVGGSVIAYGDQRTMQMDDEMLV